jgi:glutamate/aspartate transport system substrate-binding protein
MMMKRTTVRVLLAAVGLVSLLAPAFAQEQEEPVRQLTGTLKKIYSSGAVAIGYREASFPLSYVDQHGHPIGYAIDLCAAIVEQISREIDKQVRTDYVPVTSETRIPALLSDKIDLECGSTTNNVERQKQVTFSPITYVTGTKLMVRRGSGIRSYLDLKGKVVVVTAGTTNEQAMKRLNEKQKLGMNLISARDHEASYSLMADGKADAFATDDVLLYGFIARHQSQREFIVVGDYLSYDPYGIMFRKDDPQLRDVVLTTFHQLAENRDLLEIYHRWFRRRTPTGERLNLPMNAQLEEAFRVLGLPD